VINVPFHLAALDVNAGQMHDENLLKEFKLDALIDDDQLTVEHFVQVLASLKTVDCQKRLLERLIQVASTRGMAPTDVNTLLTNCDQKARTDLQPYLRALQRIVQIYIRTQTDTREGESGENLRDALLLSIEEYEDLNLALLM
jgi:hypothetical protein